MADESTRVDQWLYATLAADSTLTALIGGATTPRIYADMIPAAASYPAVVFQNQSTIGVIGATESTRIRITGVWAVFGIAETGTWVGALQDIADRVDSLLHASSGGTADSATIFTSHRIQGLRLLEERDGRQWRRLGGSYRVFAQR